MRVSGFGSEYFTYLARALVKWAMIALALGAGFVFLRWMIRTDVLISDRTWNGLLVCGRGGDHHSGSPGGISTRNLGAGWQARVTSFELVLITD